MNKFIDQYSIIKFLDLEHRGWTIEFDVQDFTTSLPEYFEIPSNFFAQNKKDFFLSFLQIFLQNTAVSFIQRKPQNPFLRQELLIELALLGFWEEKIVAIPLWTIQDLLLGFEVINGDDFTILDSEPLMWRLSKEEVNSKLEKDTLIVFGKDLFQGSKIFLEIRQGQIFISEHFSEIAFFERIAETIIPELDEDEEHE